MTIDCRANLMQLQQFRLNQTTANDSTNYWSIQTHVKKKIKERGRECWLVFLHLTCLINTSAKLGVQFFLTLTIGQGRGQPDEKDWLVQNDLHCSGKPRISALWLAIISGFNLIHNHLAVVPTTACMRASLCIGTHFNATGIWLV